MDINLHAGQRVLYKKNNTWHVGMTMPGKAELTTEGLFITILDIVNKNIEKNININSLYLNGFKLEDWAKDPEYCMPKDKFIEYMRTDKFIQERHNAFVSDGEYAYYPVNKFHETWLNKQPFNYIVISD